MASTGELVNHIGLWLKNIEEKVIAEDLSVGKKIIFNGSYVDSKDDDRISGAQDSIH
jgi:hypothetical protein